MKNTVIIIDAGGRGSALVHAYAKSPYIDRIIAIPGNDVMQINTNKEVITYQNLKTTSIAEIIEIAKKEQIALVDVAQENTVAAGLTDALKKEGIVAFGPTRAAGQIEWDKVWARDFGVRHNLPQPIFQSFSSIDDGITFITSQKQEKKWFIKASGLAEGKGVLPAKNNKEAIEKIKELTSTFNQAAQTYLIEEWVEGEEFSSFAITDGDNFQLIGSAQDHKRVNDGDSGPNTGGMGCSAPPLIINENIKDQILKIFKQTIDGLKKEGRPYTGILYLGGIIKQGAEEVYIIEFNSRWGDPEVEVILPGIQTDLYKIARAVASKNINEITIRTDEKARVAVAGASKGYPGDYSAVKGKEIKGIDEARKLDGVTIYGAGIKKVEGKYFVSGGRLLYVVAEGKDIIEVREKAYNAMNLISIEGDGLHFRKDIGYRDVARLQS